MRVAGLAMQAENGERRAVRIGTDPRCGLVAARLSALTRRGEASLLAECDRARHTSLGLRDAGVLRAVAAQVEHKIGFHRDANVGAHIVFELEPQRRRLGRLRGNDMQRQNHMIAVTDGIAAGAIGKSLGGRPQHVYCFDVFGTGEIEIRRRSGIAGVAPIGLPAGIEFDLDAGAQERSSLAFAQRARDQAGGAVHLAVPLRCVLCRCRRRSGKQNGGWEQNRQRRDEPRQRRGYGRSCG